MKILGDTFEFLPLLEQKYWTRKSWVVVATLCLVILCSFVLLCCVVLYSAGGWLVRCVVKQNRRSWLAERIPVLAM